MGGHNDIWYAALFVFVVGAIAISGNSLLSEIRQSPVFGQVSAAGHNNVYYKFIFDVPNISTISNYSDIMMIDGIVYKSIQLPPQIYFAKNSVHDYSFADKIYANHAVYVYRGISGCGLNESTGSFNTTSNCTVHVYYTKQQN